MSKTTNKNIYGKCLLNKKNLKIFFCRKDITFDLITKIEKNACLDLSLKRKLPKNIVPAYDGLSFSF